ncbi:MAG TPA: DEAD/DEAH box helicase [Verrucomicrobiae bacterium]|nr:DEAD/DEAH box helicase [Verrucomicrobiae bacterium]
MNVTADMRAAIDDFLALAQVEDTLRARTHVANGDIVELPSRSLSRYSAIVRDTNPQSVSVTYSNGVWITQCTCWQNQRCRHVLAVLLHLRGLPAQEKALFDRPAAKTAGKTRPAQRANGSPLRQKLLEHLGRDLNTDESRFVRSVQSARLEGGGMRIRETTLRSFSPAPGPWGNYWAEVEIAPRAAPDDYRFWLCVAWTLRKRKLTWPSFVDGITDLQLIEPEMAAWEHEQNTLLWHQRFAQLQDAAVPQEPVTLELLLVIRANAAQLDWRTNPRAPFRPLKPGQAKRLSEQYQSGELVIGAESLSLWSASYKPLFYEHWWNLEYGNDSAEATLNRLLRMPLPAGIVVTSAGKPLERVADPLRLELRPPTDTGRTYEMALTTADGSPVPPVLCKLSGTPTLYLTAERLFQGPSAEVMETETRVPIPVEALESVNGLRFLHQTGVPLPSHLQQRVRTVPAVVSISCNIRPRYGGASTEDVVINVDASAPGIPRETFTPAGWEVEKSNRAPRSKASNDELLVFDRSAQRHFPRILDELEVRWDPYTRDWRFRLTRDTPEKLVPWLKSLPPELELELDPELATLRDEPVSGSVSLDISEAGIDWFDLKVSLDVGDTTLTPDELKLLLNARGRYVRLGKKGWRRLQFNFSAEEDEQLARLGLSAKQFSAEPQRFHALQLADEAAKKFLGPERVETIQKRVSELKTRVAPDLPGSVRAQMRPYQTEGFHFLAYLTSNNFGGVLADDMGLGKTVQTLAWLAWLRESSQLPAHPSLVVCPKSVMDNWRAEAERFYPALRVRLWRGENAEELPKARQTADLIVVNYAQLRSLSPAIADVDWLAVILDEAQYIKNPDSLTAQSARALKASHRLALTGTPIENRLLDLWSIMSFAMPGALGNRTHFLRHFNAKDDPLARRRLSARVRPFLLRRAKSQVAKDLPDRVEEDLLCDMEGEQQTLYRAELKRARLMLLRIESHQQLNEERFNILTSLLRMRQICCHPALVNDKLRTATSAKLEALEDLLEPLMEEGHKVLVFSQFVGMLDLIRDLVKEKSWHHFYLAGQTENRGDLVREFQSHAGGAVFLISLKAGGFGLNLTAASYVVLFDPWWNPAVENQAIDRTHRIGQTSKVMAYRLLIRESIEEKIRLLQKKKAALAEDVLGEERFAQSLTLDDLRFLFAE